MAVQGDIGTPLWWLAKLEDELKDRQPLMQLMNDYYVGDHPLPFLTKAHEAKMRNEFVRLLEDSRSNFMRLVVDAVEERLVVEGFRLSASTDEAADAASWKIWQDNQMDSDSQSAFVEALVKGVSYVSVWPSDVAGASPVIAVEDPTQTIVGYEPGSNFRRRAAALKVWRDDWTGNDRANVYMPDGIYKFARKEEEEERRGLSSLWVWAAKPLTDEGGWKELPAEFVENPLGDIPIVPLRNRPRILCEGESEITDVYRIQSQMNSFLFLLMLAGYYGAHRQRYVSGLTIMEDKDGRPVEPFKTAVDDLWLAENPEAKFGEFSQTALDGYIAAIEQKVEHIAVTTRTPKHYLLPTGQEPSGDAIKSAESGLVKKVQRKQRPFGEGLEEALRLARKFAGDGDSPSDSEIVWADPQIRTEAEITDATIKKLQAQLIDHHQALEDLGYSPQQIARISAAVAAADPVAA